MRAVGHCDRQSILFVKLSIGKILTIFLAQLGRILTVLR